MSPLPVDPVLILDRLVPDDIARGMELVSTVGWNQTPDDWAMMLRLGEGFGLRKPDGVLAATSIILSYPPHTGWIGMVIVEPNWRNKGLATCLLDNAVARIESIGSIAMLDATPDGREVYRRIGFGDFATLTRWRGRARGMGEEPVEESKSLDIGEAARIASEITGVDRSALLVDLAVRGGFWALPREQGFLWARPGRTATHLGPLIAHRDEDVLALLDRALDRLSGPVLLDVPDTQNLLTQFLVAHGFVCERSFHRMARTSRGGLSLSSALRVTAGPELG